jgi:hypothetical protein
MQELQAFSSKSKDCENSIKRAGIFVLFFLLLLLLLLFLTNFELLIRHLKLFCCHCKSRPARKNPLVTLLSLVCILFMALIESKVY